MQKSPKKYFGNLPVLPSREIYLNINKLENGEYILKIIDKNKVIKNLRFKK